MAENSPIFSGTIDNPLGDITDWSDHYRLTVGVHRMCVFNSTSAHGLVEIIQQSGDDAFDETPGDFRDLEGEARVITTAEGARKLAALLISAADAADRVTA